MQSQHLNHWTTPLPWATCHCLAPTDRDNLELNITDRHVDDDDDDDDINNHNNDNNNNNHNHNHDDGVVDWKVDELKELDRKARKMMTLHGALHPKSDVDRLYLPRQKGGRGLISCEMFVKAEENNLAWYIKNSNERLMEGVRETKILNSEGAQ